MVYTIGEMAKQLNIPASTIRYYDSQGLLPFVERSKSGVRLFQEKDYEWLRVIGCLKKTGLSLDEIKDYIDLAMQGDQTLDQRLEMMLHQKEVLKQKIKEINNALDVVDYKCWFYQTAKEKGSSEAVKNMPDDQLSKKHSQTRTMLQRVNEN